MTGLRCSVNPRESSAVIAQTDAVQTSPPVHSPGLVPGTLRVRKCACGGTPGPTGECETCRKKKLQRRLGNLPAPSSINHSPSAVSEVPPIVHEVLSSPGEQLDSVTRAFMEPRFGHDFSQVRVHTDPRSAESARAVNAQAYTVGHQVVFGAGRYAPHTGEGQKLIAHELTHTVQQRDCTAGGVVPSTSSVHSSMHEDEADRVAEAIASKRQVIAPHISTGLIVAKQDENPEPPAYSFQQTYNVAQAEREVDQPANGAFFNGVVFILRRRGEVVAQAPAYSGTSGVEDWQKSRGPIPDGKHYFMMPHITKPPIKEYQYGGMVGAYGIDSGYQQISDKTVQGPWGEERIAIEPSFVCVPVPAGEKSNCALPNGKPGVFRGGFYLHGGDPGRSTTSGCIKVADKRVFAELRKFGGRVPIWVNKYKGRSSS